MSKHSITVTVYDLKITHTEFSFSYKVEYDDLVHLGEIHASHTYPWSLDKYRREELTDLFLASLVLKKLDDE